MISIRSGSGLGDALYLQAIVRHLVRGGTSLEVCCNWADLFRPLAGKIRLVRFRRDATILAHYARRRGFAGTDQFEDCCIAANAPDAELRLDWTLTRRTLVDRLRAEAAGRPIMLVMMPREPMARGDGFAMELLPDGARLQEAIDRIGGRALTVQIGKGPALYRLRRLGIDLANATTVADLLDVASVSAGALGYCGFVIPLMESFGRPGLMVWSRRGLASKNDLIRRLVPEKVIHRRDLIRAVVDDCSQDELARAVDALVDSCRGGAALRGQDGGGGRLGAGHTPEPARAG